MAAAKTASDSTSNVCSILFLLRRLSFQPMPSMDQEPALQLLANLTDLVRMDITLGTASHPCCMVLTVSR
jgi:hypothetical protein